MFRDSSPASREVIRRWVSVLRVSVLMALPLLLAGLALGQNQRQNQNSKGGGDSSVQPDAPKPLPGLNDPAATGANVDASTYVIGPNDILQIEVFREKDWSGLYPVRTDGMITIQLVGEMKASGLTPKQLEKQVAEALKDQVNDPHVTISVYDVRSKKYSVSGEVKRPGDYPLVKDTSVFEAINEAGGFLDNFSNMTDIRILRKDQIFHFNYKDYLNGKHREKNITLQNGDTIYVK